MVFAATLLAVRDMEKSLEFYKELFDQDVVTDLGWNKTLTCGLTLQLNFDRIAGFSRQSMKFGTNNMELYFETEDIGAFMNLLEKHPEVQRLHDLKTHPWHQRVVRIYDPDGHLIEVGESMQSVAVREFRAGHTVEETARITQHPSELVRQWYDCYKEKSEI